MKRFLTVLLVIGVVAVIGIIYSENKKSNNVTNDQGLTISEKKDPSQTITDTSKVILTDPNNVDAYIDKSTAEYSLDQKEAALKTVEDGLKITPDSELLKSRRDVLLRDWIPDQNQDILKE